MTGILSRSAPAFDISAAGFQGAARDLGEVVAYLAGGMRPDPETLSRLSISIRGLQGFLLEEAHRQSGHEATAADGQIRMMPVYVPRGDARAAPIMVPA